ncbi:MULTISPECIES: recombinase family protein [unclassified Variovorax]|uniref:recombinase family protein n=1 Tax=unclassified Variovorax TaxID=663243 RepID=UPI00210B6C53|nr:MULTISPECIES: recombinase family protein [unclassified Variovorax]
MEHDPADTARPDGCARRCAAEYVRMSTEHQQYSTRNQSDTIREYAMQRGIEIVRTYADEGKSGLHIDGRHALQQLIDDVQAGPVAFSVILVYDVSRWGRFQDADESAYYEYLCRRAGIQVAYCAEQFENDGSPVSTIVKGVKRAMAGEYSRELSAKVFAGQCRLVELGFRQGGPAGYGLRRVLVDQVGEVKGLLERGEQKSLQTDRVILQPGPEGEVGVVCRIFDWFVDGGLPETEIARRLNQLSIATDRGHAWSRATVHQLLTNEKYIGNNVYNRRSFKLKKRRVENSPEHWIRKDSAFEAIVDADVFYTAQGIIRARALRFTDDELLARLKGLYEHRGFLSGIVIDEAEDMPPSSAYAHRFGSLLRAYRLIGYAPGRDYRYLEINRFLRKFHPTIVADVESRIIAMSGRTFRDPATDLLDVNHEFSVSVVLARCCDAGGARRRWKVRFDTSLLPDVTVAVRLTPANDAALDYYLLPRLDFGQVPISLTERNAVELESYRFATLDYLYGMASQTPLRRCA